MIGQTQLLEKIDKILDSYPKFSIIVGAKGSGKKTIVKHICNKLRLPIVNFGTSIEDVRKVIDLSYEQTEPICYVCADADAMSLGAKNCLLKITEEPPHKAYFILTLQSLSNTLETIQSRGTVLNLDPYSTTELKQYTTYRDYPMKYDKIVDDICSTTGEVDELFKCDVDKFYKFAQTIANQIHIPNTGNIFKISKQIKAKEDDVAYDSILLFKAVRLLFLQNALKTKKPQYLKASQVTSEYLRQLNITNLNKVATVDSWIMDVRSVLRGV